MTEEELSQYDDYMKEIEELNKKVKELKNKNIDTYDMELETSLALEKVKTAQMSMAETYIDSVKSRIKTVEERY
jgi:cell division septal protein FtsQ